MIIGYVRVSSTDQNEARQLEGIKLDKKFIDKCSGKNKNRPELISMIDFSREGDSVLIHSIDRLARNLKDLKEIVNALLDKGVSVKFIKESLEFKHESDHVSKLMLNMLGSFAEFERDMIKERQLEGIAIAKKQGKYKGRKQALNKEETQSLLEKLNSKFYKNKSQLAKEYNISRCTLYQYQKKYQCLDNNFYQIDVEDFT